MGIRGLSTFINQNPHLSKAYKLHDTSVVIDGNNLIHVLYFSHKIDFMYGGDYSKYASSIRKYLSSYLECNVKPIIIFDGGYDKSDRKFNTVLKRTKDRLTLTQHIAKYGQCSGHVLPIMAHYVFETVLREMGISFARCDFEADDQITALANYYKCPVVSNDSDFYVFDVHYGFVQLDSIEPNVFTENDSAGNQYSFLKCCIYHVDKFLSHFPGINKDVLPLFGTLIGNDYVNSSTFETFFSNIHLPKYKGGGLKVYSGQERIIGVLCWLKDNNLKEAINKVLSHLKKGKRVYVKSLIDYAVDGYKLQQSNLVFIIDNRLRDFKRELKLNTTLTAPCGQALPAHFIIKFNSGCFPSFVLNVIVLHRMILLPQVENIALESSYMCSRFIRQVLYGILIRHEDSESEQCQQKCLCDIEEYDRRSGSQQKELVKPVFSLDNFGALPKLSDLKGLEKKKAKTLLLEVLGVHERYMSAIPEEWQLLIGCVIYWLKNCTPSPREEFIYALILNIIYFSLLKKPRLFKKDDLLNAEGIRDRSERVSTPDLIQNISDVEKQTAAKHLKKYIPKPVFNHGNPLILHIVHSFSQLQACVLYLMYLNKLLGSPYMCPVIHKSYSGVMVYNLTKDMLSRQFPELFVAELLGRESILNNLFSTLKCKIFENIPDNCFVKIDTSFPRKRKKKKKREPLSSSVADKGNNKFSCLSALEDDDDENSVYI